MTSDKKYNGLEIALIGISGRFPASEDHRQYWRNLEAGIEMVRSYSPGDPEMGGVGDMLSSEISIIRSAGMLDNKNLFDSSFFAYGPEEASLMDPQIRLFHEHCWMALEDSGYSSCADRKKIGLFAGASINDSWKMHAYGRAMTSSVNPFYSGMLSDRSFISTLISYKLNLRGPSIYVDTACSTSLAAVHFACRSLLTRECSIALAGGVSVNTTKRKGYVYEEGMIYSNDGHCRAFDAQSSGTVPGEGVGVVVLKCLSEAINDRDHIYAIIKSTFVNNDGNHKVGYSAPGMKGQAECISTAQKLAAVSPRSISYVETHGTGTRLGDPVEIMALNNAFGTGGHEKFCAIGSVKTNMGHLDAAAGVAGLIKTALSLKHKKIPASLHYREPNPEIDFAGGPFYVNAGLQEWRRSGDSPLRAGVSSFGIGGTNVHAILEEPPPEEKCVLQRNYKLLTISARTEGALSRYIDKLKNFLQDRRDIDLADMCYTLQAGRKHFEYRKSVVFGDFEELMGLLDDGSVKEHISKAEERTKLVVFMFPGQGSQYQQMGRDLYRHERLFREKMDEGFRILSALTGVDFRAIIYPGIDGQCDDEYVLDTENELNRTRYAQPIIFLLEYSLAQLMISYGIIPQYMIGHSIGEYVAACVSGVFSPEDAFKLIVRRGELMDSLPGGLMISVPMNEEEAIKYLDNDISLAAVNGSEQVVFSGEIGPVTMLIDKLNKLQIPNVKLHTSHAFHSGMQDPILAAFKSELEKVEFAKPRLPFISNLTGKFIQDDEAASPDYWKEHLRNTVRFADGIETLLAGKEDLLFVEVGAGRSLTSLLKQQNENKLGTAPLNLIGSLRDKENAEKYFLDKLGNLWAQGIPVDWGSYYNKGEKRQRMSLPVYSFEPTRYPAEADSQQLIQNKLLTDMGPGGRRVSNWFYTPEWKQTRWLPGKAIDPDDRAVLIFSDDHGLAEILAEDLGRAKANCFMIKRGAEYKKVNDHVFVINPFRGEDLDRLFRDLGSKGVVPRHIFHLWNFEEIRDVGNLNDHKADYHHKMGYESLLLIARTFPSVFPAGPMRLDVVSSGLYGVTGHETIVPQKSTLLGAVKVIPLEFGHISCRAIDIMDTSEDSIRSLLRELKYMSEDNEIAIRGKRRYIKHFEKVDLQMPADDTVLKKKGTYLITGANGGMGKLFSSFLVDKLEANLILTGRGEVEAKSIYDLEKKGVRVFYIQADIGDAGKLEEGILNGERVCGKIDGVIHTAGSVDAGGVIVRRTEEDDTRVFCSKLTGTEVLYGIMQNRDLDFFVNCSSQAASLPSFGQVAYVAANIYLDMFAIRGNPSYPVISIEWPALREVGMAVRSISHLSSYIQSELLQDGISPQEAIEVLVGALFLKFPLLIISTTDFQHSFNNHWTLVKDRGTVAIPDDDLSYLERPGLSTTYIAPGSEIEKRLIVLIQDLLKMENIGIEDNFFELGGDSLKAMVLIKRINRDFDMHVSLKDMFEMRTVREIAGEIESAVWLRSDMTMNKKVII